MEEIKVGEYVRTKNKGIKKIAYLRSNATVNGYAYFIGYDDDGDRLNGILKTTDIVKHSFNIIDILKIGDFIYTDYGWGWYHHKVDENTIVIDDGDEFIDVNKDEIHRILTQEMLWNNSYELKE